ncbi:FAD:protein FMN transferase [Weissella paramesenteroides]
MARRIENPADPQSIIREITIQNGAIATSGFSKRGQHIKRISPDDSLTQATIIANELIVADVMATTAIAMERQKFEAFANKQNLHGLLITNTSQQINF